MSNALSGELPNTLGDCNRIRELDGLRGIAIGMVVIFHFFQNSLAFRPGSTFAYLQAGLRLSWSGVDLFFPDSSSGAFCSTPALQRIITPFSTGGAFSESFPFTLLHCFSFQCCYPWGGAGR
jgi:hypothetical protein